MANRVQTTADERETIEARFTSLVTVLYDEFVVLDGVSAQCFERKTNAAGRPRPFTRDDVKVTQKWADNNELAHLGTASDYWKLGIKFDQWRRRSAYNKLTTLVHEAAHLPRERGVAPDEEGTDVHHPLPFWQRYATLADRITPRHDALDHSFDVPARSGPVVCDAISHARRYAPGIDAADEWTSRLINSVRYENELYEAFHPYPSVGPFAISYESEACEQPVDVPVHLVDFPGLTDRELFDQFEARFTWEDGTVVDVELPRPPRVRESRKKNDEVLKYSVEEGDEELFALAARQLRPTVDCEVTRRL